VISSVKQDDRVVLGNLRAKSDATPAKNTTLPVKLDRRSQRHGFDVVPLGLYIAACTGSIQKCLILQRTFAGSVTNGAVEWMVSQQELKYSPLRLLRDWAPRANRHAIGHWSGACSNGLGSSLLFDQAGSTCPHRTQLGVIAEDWNIDPVGFAGFPKKLSLGNLQMPAIYRNLHMVFHQDLRWIETSYATASAVFLSKGQPR
jgi:hypothetical protein